MRTICLGICLNLCLSSIALAYEPSEVDAGAKAYDKSTICQSLADNCINTVCVEGNSPESKSPHCTQNCTDEAAAKCAKLND
jgi:hypothetical protein